MSLFALKLRREKHFFHLTGGTLKVEELHVFSILELSNTAPKQMDLLHLFLSKL